MNITQLVRMKDELVTYSPVARETVNQAEKELQLSFANEYVEYVMVYGIAIFDGHELTGMCDGKRLDVVRNTMEQRRLNSFVPMDWYVVECLDIDGIVVWQDKAGKVYQTAPNGTMNLMSESLVEYLRN